MRTFLLAAVAVTGMALTTNTADAGDRHRRGRYVGPVYSNGFVARPYTGFYGGGLRGWDRPSYAFNPVYGNPYPRSGFSIGFGTGGFSPYGGFGSPRGFGYPYGGFRRW